jgi:hypothetical protein
MARSAARELGWRGHSCRQCVVVTAPSHQEMAPVSGDVRASASDDIRKLRAVRPFVRRTGVCDGTTRRSGSLPWRPVASSRSNRSWLSASPRVGFTCPPVEGASFRRQAFKTVLSCACCCSLVPVTSTFGSGVAPRSRPLARQDRRRDGLWSSALLHSTRWPTVSITSAIPRRTSSCEAPVTTVVRHLSVGDRRLFHGGALRAPASLWISWRTLFGGSAKYGCDATVDDWRERTWSW